MTTLACGTITQCGSSHLTGLGWLLIIGGVALVAEIVDFIKRKLGIQPAYTAPVRAVTPGGIAVTQRQCCRGGRQSPAQAVAHAERVPPCH
ncbi:MAG TPA: hypothetical protein VMV92_28685 [Streptosporangiaceae bacterium]|nr:hypothetical protein [Streptosporangiaceae bacterium]